MVEKIRLSLLSPDKQLYAEDVEMIVLPGEQGDFAVLSHHSSLIAAVRSGLLVTYEKDAIQRRIYIDSGVAQIQDKECKIFVNEYFIAENLKMEEIKELIKQKKKELEEAQSQEERRALERDLHVAYIKMNLISPKSK